MPNDPPAVLDYQSSASQSNGDALWRVFRLAVIAWTATVLVRHASYWGSVAAGSGWMRFDLRPATFAAIESALLIAVLCVAATPRREGRATLAGLCAAYLVIAIVGLSFDLKPTLAPDPASILRAVWVVASRVQGWVVPGMAIAAYGTRRPRSVDS